MPGLIEIGYPSRETFSACQRVLGKGSFYFMGEVGGERGEEDAFQRKSSDWSSPWGHPTSPTQDGGVRTLKELSVSPGTVWAHTLEAHTLRASQVPKMAY